MIQVCVPTSLDEAVKLAANREMSTISEYVRRVLIARLRADGIDPTAKAHARPSSGVELRA
jgi:hypothetical protein